MRDELLGAILCGLVAWLVWRTLLRRKTGANDWMPRELRASRLAYAEQLFRSTGSVSAKVDRAYRDPAGVVTLVELKTRKAERVHLSDVIELSAQRYALKSQTGERVSETVTLSCNRSVQDAERSTVSSCLQTSALPRWLFGANGC